jgi:hypothetical protein
MFYAAKTMYFEIYLSQHENMRHIYIHIFLKKSKKSQIFRFQTFFSSHAANQNLF